MKTLAAITFASVIALASASPAEARQGCGPGFHRAPNGACISNRGPRQVFVVGRFYPGRGYWYNSRWYQQRVRARNGWRYR
ncbi:MAG: hypothetical protein QOD54_1654 [Sphingomonadales bacterium]|nr:hypothetical protein [Sphingomonadales bacterium]